MSLAAPLILASSSRYRAELLGRLRLAFRQASPDVDERALPGEGAETLARRLAQAKAEALGRAHPEAWILGSDQVADCAGTLLGKPGDRDRAREQLRRMAGRESRFLTAVSLYRHADGAHYAALDETRVQLRALDDAEIERYLDAEPAYDCAGSAKIEALGISLCEAVHSSDPTALIGLPLIATARLLRQAGFALP